jgi:hypothetical protein
MKIHDRTQPSPETIVLKPGSFSYPIREVEQSETYGRNDQPDDEVVDSELALVAQLVQVARETIENQGGIFNGIISREVQREDPAWRAVVTISVLYVLAHLPERNSPKPISHTPNIGN